MSWPTIADYAMTRKLFSERYPGLRLEMTDIRHEDGYDVVTYYTMDGIRIHKIALDEDNQVVLRPYKQSCTINP